MSKVSLDPPYQQTILLLFALLVLLDDWLFYNLEIEKLDNCTRSFAICFLTDIIVLALWYLFTLQIRNNYNPNLLLISLMGFFLTTSLWELIFNVKSVRQIFKNTDFPLIFLYLTLLAVQYICRTSPIVSITGMILLFILYRLIIWIPLFRKGSVINLE